MKTCPKCGASYADELSFCLQDGTPLPARPTAGFSNAPTEAFRPGTNPADDISAAESVRGPHLFICSRMSFREVRLAC